MSDNGPQNEESSLLRFAPPTPADLPLLRRIIPESCRGSDCAAANIFLLRQKYHTTIAIHGPWLFRHFAQNERLHGYAFPCGQGDPTEALELLRRDAAQRERPLRFCLLTDEQCDILRRHMPGQFSFANDRGNADYLYDRSKLAELPGPRFHAKRNHIAQFESMFPEWRFSPLSPATAPDALAVAEGWLEKADNQSQTLNRELDAIREALDHAEDLELFGGVIYVQDQPIGMSVGSFITPSVADIHFEKCLPEYRRAYSLLNRETARLLPESCRFINREEDLNQSGLRQAKLSYHPECILEKCDATPLPCPV